MFYGRIVTPLTAVVTAYLLKLKTQHAQDLRFAHKKQCLFYCVIACLLTGAIAWTQVPGESSEKAVAASSQAVSADKNSKKVTLLSLADFGANEIQNLLWRVNYFQHSPRFHEQGYRDDDAALLYEELGILYRLALAEQSVYTNDTQNERSVVVNDIAHCLHALMHLMDRYLFDRGEVDSISRQHLFTIEQGLARLRIWHYQEYFNDKQLHAVLP